MKKNFLLLIPIVAALSVWVFSFGYERINFIPGQTYPCVSYAPRDILQKERYAKEELLADLKKIRKISDCVRVYGVTNGLEEIPSLADSLDMDVILGAWLDLDPNKNDLEIQSLVKTANAHNNIRYIVVGNETQLMGLLSAKDLYARLDFVREHVSQPVTTGEPLAVWVSEYDLSEHVDVIGLHQFPYWEEVSVEQATGQLAETLDFATEGFSKPIVMLELGWPTDGPNNGDARTGIINQRRYLQDTAELMSSRGIFYNVAEGIDVPSKLSTTEGLVGLHWGILSQQGNEKHLFSLSALLLYIFLYVFFAYVVCRYNRRLLATYRDAAKDRSHLYVIYAIIAASAGLLALLLVRFYQLYLLTSPVFEICFTLLATYAYFECMNRILHLLLADFAHTYALGQERDGGTVEDLARRKGKVSILVAAKDEDAGQVIRTITSLTRQAYPDIEILYIDNNSRNRESFDTVSNHFKDIPQVHLHFEKSIDGYKAGALNYLLARIHVDSKFVAVVDADYVVDPLWIDTALRYVRAGTGFVQFPQAYTLEQEDIRLGNMVQVGATVEQAYVFDVVYPVRSIMGDIVQNGTMVVIDRTYIGQGWPTYSICEDAAFGLEISNRGGKALYLPIIMGKGLPPKTFKALKKQRNRWVFGAIQIMQYACARPFQRINRTVALFAIDWLGWFVQGLYPALLLSSMGFIIFVWLVYLHVLVSWVTLVGFSFVFLSLLLFVITYIRTYRKGRSLKIVLTEIVSLIVIECALVNTIAKTVLSGFLFRRAEFVITRHAAKVSAKDLATLVAATFVSFVGVFLYCVLWSMDISTGIKILGTAQLSVVMFPQFAYMYLLMKY